MEGFEAQALCSARRLLEGGAVAWLGFELNRMTTSKRDANRIRALLRRAGMAHRPLVPGLPEWDWSRAGRQTGYMVMYSYDARGAVVPSRRVDADEPCAP